MPGKLASVGSGFSLDAALEPHAKDAKGAKNKDFEVTITSLAGWRLPLAALGGQPFRVASFASFA